jgi:hypothetical protein
MSNEIVEIFGTIMAETDKAILLFDGVEESWLPLSQIEYDMHNEVGDDLTVEVPEWLAIESGFV